MAENKIGPNLQAGAGFLAKRVQKSLNRAQEKVSQGKHSHRLSLPPEPHSTWVSPRVRPVAPRMRHLSLYVSRKMWTNSRAVGHELSCIISPRFSATTQLLTVPTVFCCRF